MGGWGAWLAAPMGYVGWWLGLQCLALSSWLLWVLHMKIVKTRPSHEDCQDSSFTLAIKFKSCEQYIFFTIALWGGVRDEYLPQGIKLLTLEDHYQSSSAISPSPWLCGLQQFHADKHLDNLGHLQV